MRNEDLFSCRLLNSRFTKILGSAWVNDSFLFFFISIRGLMTSKQHIDNKNELHYSFCHRADSSGFLFIASYRTFRPSEEVF